MLLLNAFLSSSAEKHSVSPVFGIGSVVVGVHQPNAPGDGTVVPRRKKVAELRVSPASVKACRGLWRWQVPNTELLEH